MNKGVVPSLAAVMVFGGILLSPSVWAEGGHQPNSPPEPESTSHEAHTVPTKNDGEPLDLKKASLSEILEKVDPNPAQLTAEQISALKGRLSDLFLEMDRLGELGKEDQSALLTFLKILDGEMEPKPAASDQPSTPSQAQEPLPSSGAGSSVLAQPILNKIDTLSLTKPTHSTGSNLLQSGTNSNLSVMSIPPTPPSTPSQPVQPRKPDLNEWTRDSGWVWGRTEAIDQTQALLEKQRATPRPPEDPVRKPAQASVPAPSTVLAPSAEPKPVIEPKPEPIVQQAQTPPLKPEVPPATKPEALAKQPVQAPSNVATPPVSVPQPVPQPATPVAPILANTVPAAKNPKQLKDESLGKLTNQFELHEKEVTVSQQAIQSDRDRSTRSAKISPLSRARERDNARLITSGTKPKNENNPEPIYSQPIGESESKISNWTEKQKTKSTQASLNVDTDLKIPELKVGSIGGINSIQIRDVATGALLGSGSKEMSFLMEPGLLNSIWLPGKNSEGQNNSQATNLEKKDKSEEKSMLAWMDDSPLLKQLEKDLIKNNEIKSELSRFLASVSEEEELSISPAEDETLPKDAQKSKKLRQAQEAAAKIKKVKQTYLKLLQSD